MKSNPWLRWRSLTLAVLIYPLLVSCGSGGTNAVQSGPPRLQSVLTGLDQPVFVTNAGDGSGRLFVVEQPGRIKSLPRGAASPGLFLELSTKVLSGGERGLLGLAFHPRFATNRRFFVNYTRQPDGATVIAEYHQSAGSVNVADATETVLLTIAQPFANHNGGMLAFGKDGYLYIGMGDGGSANDPGSRAQNIDELLGKILRIDVDHPGAGVPYSAPADNPYYGAVPGRDEIYALGLRNPWRFSFDRQTGDLIAGDVGQDAREEIDAVTRGGNFGWRVREGTVCTNNDPSACGRSDFIAPLTDYDHSGGRCSVTGGYVYRGAQGTLSLGAYVFGDYCSGEVFLLQNGAQKVLMSSGQKITSFGEDEAGEIYMTSLDGTLTQLVPAGRNTGL